MKRVVLALIVIVFLLSIPAFALAQDAPSPAVPTIEPFLKGLFDYINQGTSIIEIAALALILTQLVKYWIVDRFWVKADGTPKIASSTVHVAVQILLWGGHVVAVHFGYGQQYLETGQAIGAFLTSMRGILIPATASAVLADIAYKKLHAAKVSGFRFESRKAA